MKELFFKVLKQYCIWLASWNKSYDKIEEPRRLIIGAGIAMVPLIILYIVALILDSVFFNAVGLIWITSIICIRIWWLEGNLKNFLMEDEFIDMTKTL